MPRRYYSSTAARTTLSSGINSTATSITVGSVSGFPGSFPYTLILDQDTASEEVVNVTAASGTTLTVTRGQDGTTGVSHSSGAAVNHGVSARDFDEPNAHVNDTTTDVHPQYVTKALLTAKAAIVTATAASTPAALTVGANDTVLTADSTTATGLAWKAASSLPSQTSQAGKFLTTNGTAASWVDPPTNRNALINGHMAVSQRSTSTASVTGNGYHTTDRWYTNMGTAGTFTQSVENDGPAGTGIAKSLKMLCTTAKTPLNASDFCLVRQDIEGQNLQMLKKGTSSAEQITLSFWVKANVTGTYVVEIRDMDNTRIICQTYTVSASATWEKKTLTFAGDTTGALDNDNGASLQAIFWLVAGTTFTSGTLATTWAASNNANRAVGQTNLAAATNNYWQITGVQLETGPVATPFEFEPYEATLRKCQRYYQRYISDVAYGMLGEGKAYSTSVVQIRMHHTVPMRAVPTAIDTSAASQFYLETGASSQAAITSLAMSGTLTNRRSTVVEFTKSASFTTGAYYHLYSNNDANCFIGITAEL